MNGSSGALTGTDIVISEDLGQQRGANLFHSFGEFNIASGQTVTFTGGNANPISNVISRVTGANPSLLDGTLRSDIAGANFFLLNPNGIQFGSNVTIDVSGSFHASTADYVRFDDDAQFTAAPGANDAALLTAATPSAFGFLGNRRPAPIVAAGAPRVIDGDLVFPSLSTSPGGTLSLVGGNLTISSFDILAPAGQINLVSLAEGGEIDIAGSAPTISADTRRGDIEIRDGFLDVSNDAAAIPGGNIYIRGGRFALNGSFIESFAGAGNGGVIDISAQQLSISESRITAATVGSGQAADITIFTEQLNIDNSGSAAIQNFTMAAGSAGAVSITAGEAITISENGGNIVNIGLEDTGNAGDIIITTPTLTMLSGLIQAQASPDSQGNSGNIMLNVQSLTLANGAQIDARTNGPGRGGNVSIADAHSISITGQGIDDNGQTFPSGIFSNTRGTGDAGSITIDTDFLTLTQNGRISVGNSNSDLTNTGDSGTINLTVADALLLDNGLITSSTPGTGQGGNIRIDAHRVTLQNSAEISASSLSNLVDPRPGDAGNISISAGQNVFLDNSIISSSSNQAGGGGISVDAMESVILRNSAITTEVLGEAGSNAGDISIGTGLPLTFIVLDNSNIIANAIAGPGNGGAITLRSEQILRSTDSTISASAGPAGIDGTVQISSPDTDVSSGITVLPAEFFDASTILNQGCAGRGAENVGRLVIDGRGGLPIAPDTNLGASNAVRLGCNP